MYFDIRFIRFSRHNRLANLLWLLASSLCFCVLAFGNGSVVGEVWVDANADEVKQAGEERVANARVKLFVDNNDDGLASRVVADFITGADGAYSFTGLAAGRYQIGIDLLSLPDDLYRLTPMNQGGDEALDNDVDPHTLRSEILDLDGSGPTEVGIGFLQGDGSLRYIGTETVSGEPAHVWQYQDCRLKLQDLGYDPSDATIVANVTRWLKWYSAGERMLQEAEMLPGYLDLARFGGTADGSYKTFLTINGLGSYATGRNNCSSGVPAQQFLDVPDVLVDHMLVLYELTRGSNPIWKYRSTWPFGARLTHHGLTALSILELGGMDAAMQVPNVTPWNSARDSIEALRRWEAVGTTFEAAFPQTLEGIPNLGEQVNNYSIDLPDPDDTNRTYRVGARDLLTAIIVRVAVEQGRDSAVEVLHNMSRKPWYIPTMEQALIAFREAVNDATDDAYADDFVTKWGFPANTTYNDSRGIDSGAFVAAETYEWDCKPHDYDPALIQTGFGHLSDRTTQGFARWEDNNGSGLINLGGVDFISAVTNITYPNQDAYLVVGVGVDFVQQVSNGIWAIEILAINDASGAFTVMNNQVLAENEEATFVRVENGELRLRFEDQVNLVKLTIKQTQDTRFTTGPFVDQTKYIWDFNRGGVPIQPGALSFTPEHTQGFMRWDQAIDSFPFVAEEAGSLTNVYLRNIIFLFDPTSISHQLRNGNWEVKVILADEFEQKNIQVSAEGEIVAANLDIAENEFAEVVFEVTISDGELNLAFENNPNGDGYGIAGLELTFLDDVTPVDAPPTITLTGGLVDVAAGDAYNEPGYTATDAEDGDLTASVVIDNPVPNPSVPGVYTVSYDVTDSAGNPASTSRVVTVTDQTAPVIVLTGGPVTLAADSAFVEPGYTATDNVDGDLTDSVMLTSTIPSPIVPGTYSVRYDVSDAAGNPASTSRVVTVVAVADQTAPVIVLTGGPVTLEAGSAFVEPGYTATDLVDGDLTDSVLVTSTIPSPTVPGTYSVRYDVSDTAGNPASTSRVVTVEYTGSPVITLADSTITLLLGQSYAEPGYAASDALDGDLTASVTVSDNIPTAPTLGSFVVSYQVTNSVGNVAETNRIVNVLDGDPDNDGMPSSWEIPHGLDSMTPDGAEDPDRDGFTNAEEYIADTDPNDAASVLRLNRFEVDGTRMIGYAGVATRNYTLEASPAIAGDSMTWTPMEGHINMPGTPNAEGIVLVPDLSPAGQLRFYRLRAQLP